jgi:hypothetical protein
MTGTASTLDGESNLRFDGTTLTQNSGSLPATSLGGFTSNQDSADLVAPGRYAGGFYYSGETIRARACGANVAGVGLVQKGQLCYWNFDSANFGFDLVDGSSAITNTYMLAIALEDITYNAYGMFLLKGFVSSNYVDITTGTKEGAPLYIQRFNFGQMTDDSSWTGSIGVDVWRTIGYLVTNPINVSGATFKVIRFDPSTDYTI